MPKVSSGIRKSQAEQEREKKQRYRAKVSPELKRLEAVVSPTPKKEKPVKEQKIVSSKPLARFVALDGEGKNDASRNFTYLNPDGDETLCEHQDYVLLRSSSDQLDPLYNPRGLTTAECFSYLCNLSLKEYGATFVGFGLSYDTTMWLRDLSYKEQKYLREYMAASDEDMYEYVEEEGTKTKKKKMRMPSYLCVVDDVPNTKYVAFEYEYQQRKWFRVTRYECEVDEKGKWRYRYDSRGKRIRHGSIIVYDVWGFFQSSFVGALSEYNLLTDEDDAQFLASMKSKRDQFEYLDIEQIDAYCKKECVYLVRLMEKLQEYFRHPAVDIQLSRWDGAGAAAAYVLKRENIKEHLPTGKEDFPDEVMEAALHAYSGGRIELIQYGHIETKKEYTEKKARDYCKKHGKDMDKLFLSATYLRRRKSGELIVKEKATHIVERLIELKGVRKPYGKDAIKDYTKAYITPYLEHYYDEDHVGYFLPCVFDYDINSAYPTTTAELPSLRGGTWKREKEIKTKFAMVRIKWDLWGQRIFPFFYRTSDHLIVYPSKGENWVWLPEYEAYLKHQDKFQGSVKVVEVWNFYPATDVKPFAFIPKMASQRLEWKKLAKRTNNAEGGQHVATKLALNSLYGKLAQQVGGSKQEDGSWKLPPYLNMAWAGYITASTRARLFDAAMADPESVVMFATDGLFTTSQLDLPLSDKLGEWEVSRFTSFTAVQAGVYYRETSDWQSLSKSRGFEKGSITEKKVLDGWRDGQWQDQNGEWQNDVLGSSRCFVTFGRIAVGEKEEVIKRNMKRLCCWERRERKLSLDPRGTKREDDGKYFSTKRNTRLVPTVPRSEYLDEYSSMSTRYRSPYYTPVEELSIEDKNYMQRLEDKKETENIGES